MDLTFFSPTGDALPFTYGGYILFSPRAAGSGEVFFVVRRIPVQAMSSDRDAMMNGPRLKMKSPARILGRPNNRYTTEGHQIKILLGINPPGFPPSVRLFSL